MLAKPREVRGEAVESAQSRASDRKEHPESKRLGGLVLARQLGECVMIGDSIMVEVIGLKSNTVRLRIVAPRSVAVHRREVYDSIRFAPRPAATQNHEITQSPAPAGHLAHPGEGGLVLTRREGQTIMVGDEVAIDVVDARPGTVRLRVIAPRSIAVHRREVYEAIRDGLPRADVAGLDRLG